MIDDVTLSAGTRVGNYEILAPLGVGGMGEVYRALDPRLRREVAIKILPANFFTDPARRRRLEQEARAAGALNHPNLLTIYELGSHDDAPFIVSELLVGQTLRGKLAAGALPPRQATDYALQIAKGLAAAHDKGIIHRDLKPENIFITTDGRLKILDFGLAKLNEPIAPGDAADTDLLTQPGVVLGTVGYMSPEQVTASPVDERSDIFAFGAIIFEMLWGRPAFRKGSAGETIAAILTTDPVSTVPPALPPSLLSIVRHCLEKEPERRFHSARDIALALEWGPGPAVVARRRLSYRAAAAAIAAIVVIAIAGSFLWFRSTRLPRIDSLAVLPLTDLSGTPDRYFADGVTEELIDGLAQIRSLRVIPRTSTERYIGTKKSFREIARELNADGIVTGSVLRSAGKVRVTAQLIDPERNRQLWANQYERPLGDVLTLQDDLARGIADRLRIHLTPNEQQRLTSARRVSPEAHDAYLKGRSYLNRAEPESLSRAITFFQEAIKRDPGYGAPYAGLADCYAEMGFMGILLPTEAYPSAKEAALTALRLDPNLAEARVSLAIVLSNYDWNFKEAEEKFRQALDLNPSYDRAHGHYAMLLMVTGRADQAIAETRRTLELTPLGVVANNEYPWMFYLAHRYDESIRQYQKTLELSHDNLEGQEGLADAYAAVGRDAEAFASYQQWARLAGFPAEVLRDLDRAYSSGGLQGYWRKRLEMENKETAETGDVWPYRMAALYARVHETDQAFSWLERAYAEHSNRLIFLRVDPVFETLRNDVRFQNLLQRIGLA